MDGSRSAQFEHTMLVTESGCELLTGRIGQPTDRIIWDVNNFKRWFMIASFYFAPQFTLSSRQIELQKEFFFILILFYSVLVMSVNIWSLWRNNSVRITSVGILRNLLSIVPSELGTEGSYLFQRYEFLCLYFKEWLLSSSCKAILR